MINLIYLNSPNIIYNTKEFYPQLKSSASISLNFFALKKLDNSEPLPKIDSASLPGGAPNVEVKKKHRPSNSLEDREQKSNGIYQNRNTLIAEKKNGRTLEDLPPEIMIEIAKNIDLIDSPEDFSSFCQISKVFYNIGTSTLLSNFNFQASSIKNDLLYRRQIEELLNSNLAKKIKHSYSHPFNILLKYILLGKIKNRRYPFYALKLLLKNIKKGEAYPEFTQQDFIYMGLLKNKININNNSKAVDEVIRRHSYHLYRALPMLFTEAGMNLEKFLIVVTSKNPNNPKITLKNFIEIGVMDDPKLPARLEQPELDQEPTISAPSPHSASLQNTKIVFEDNLPVLFLYERLPWLFGWHKKFTLRDLSLLKDVLPAEDDPDLQNGRITPDAKLNQAFREAIESANTEVVDNIIKSKLVLEFEREDKTSLLARLAAHGNQRSIDFLIQKGINTKQRGNYEITLLMIAVQNNHQGVAELLLEHDIKSIEERDIFGCCALVLAAKNGYLELVKYLVGMWSRYLAQTSQRKSNNLIDKKTYVAYRFRHSLAQALVKATQNGYLNTVEYLLSDQVKVNILGSSRAFEHLLSCQVKAKASDALIQAVRGGHLHIVKYLLKQHRVNINATDDSGATTLTWAAYLGHLHIVKYLLTWPQINVNTVDDMKYTALMWAAEKGYLEIVKSLLLHNKTSVESSDSNAEIALIHAALGGHRHIVEYLVEDLEVNVTACNEDGMSPLMAAARYGRLDLIKYFLGKRGSLQELDNEQSTILMYAALSDCKEAVEYLVGQGMSVAARNALGETPLMWATRNGHLHLIKYFLVRGANPEDLNDEKTIALMYASGCAKEELVKYLQQRGINLLARKTAGAIAALIWAALSGNHKVLEYFILRGTPVDIRNEAKETLLILTAKKGYLKAAKCLIEKGAALDALDNQRSSARMWAEANQHEHVARYLCSLEKNQISPAHEMLFSSEEKGLNIVYA